MAFKIRTPHVIALGISAAIVAWMATGEVKIGGQAHPDDDTPPIAEREAERSASLFKVRYVTVNSENRQKELEVRGRTQAKSVVPVRAETGGIVLKRLVEKGDYVNEGDLVCEIDPGSREAKVARAKAQLLRARTDHESNVTLKEQGFSSNSKVQQLNATMQAAIAELAEAEIELERTNVRANASGIVQDPIAEPGDVLSPSGTCVTLIDPDPMLVVGQVSERDIGNVKLGMDAEVDLITGSNVPGKITYVSTSADANTRTFLVEIEIANPENRIFDGLTANARIQLESIEAFRISPSWITLADDGSIGLRMVSDEDIVRFVEIKILAQTNDGFWVTGPKSGMRVITVGQEYVISGEKVEPVPDPIVNAGLAVDGSGKNGKSAQ